MSVTNTKALEQRFPSHQGRGAGEDMELPKKSKLRFLKTLARMFELLLPLSSYINNVFLYSYIV